MKKKIIAARQKRAEHIQAMQSLHDAAHAENRDLADNEIAAWNQHKADAEKLQQNITMMEEQDKLNTEMSAPTTQALKPMQGGAPAIVGKHPDSQLIDEAGFASFGHFLQAVKAGNDERLEFVTQSMGSGSEGGFLVPQQFGEQLKTFKPGEAIVRPKATVIPAGEYPDAEISFPGLDQSGSKGVYSGVATQWIEEGGDIPETAFSTREIKLGSKGVAAYIPFTNKLLANAPAAGALGEMLLRQAIAKAEDAAFLNGDGVGKPLGFIGHASAKAINRGTANTFKYADAVTMFAASKGEMREWIMNVTVIPQLLQMVDGLGNLIFQPNAVAAMGMTLLGLPIRFVDRTPVLGTKGDVILADLSYYYVKNGSGIIISMSEHVLFKQHKTLIKAVSHVDGQSSLSGPLTLEDGSTTVSPFVVLDVPSA